VTASSTRRQHWLLPAIELMAAGNPAHCDPRARRWPRIPLFLHLRAIKPG